MKRGWITLHRKFIEWEWFDNPEMVQLFLFLLLEANHADKDWRGIVIKRGQLVTSLASINSKTNLSIRTIRTCLKRLKSTSEVTIKTTNRYSIITICKYDDYQDLENKSDKLNDKQSDKQTTSKRQTKDKQTTTNNHYNNKTTKTNKNTAKFNFKKSLLEIGVTEQTANDWLLVRKQKKAANTKTAFNRIIKEIEKSGLPANECIKISAERSWSGFNADWINAENNKNHPFVDKRIDNYEQF